MPQLLPALLEFGEFLLLLEIIHSHNNNDIESSRVILQSNIIYNNGDLHVGEIRQFCQLQDEGQSLMRVAMCQLSLSARAYHRILKLARRGEEIQSHIWRLHCNIGQN